MFDSELDFDSGGLLSDDAPADDRGLIRFRKARDIGDVINATFGLIKENFREIGTGLLFVVGPFALISIIASVIWQQQMATALDPNAVNPNDPFALFSVYFGVAYLFLMLAGGATFIVLSTVTYAFVDLYRNGFAGEITPKLLWAETRDKLWACTGMTLLIVAAAVLSVVIWIIPCLGMLAWMGFWVYAWPIIMLAFVARLMEEHSIVESWKRAVSLIKGQWWMTFGTFVVVALITTCVMLACYIPYLALGFGTGLVNLDPVNPGSTSVFVQAIGSALGYVAYAAGIIPTIASIFHYYNLVERVEGTSLFAEVDLIESRGLGAPAQATPSVSDLSSPSSIESDPPFGKTDTRSGGFRGGGFDEPDNPIGGR